MKKFVSIFVAVLSVAVFAVPTFAFMMLPSLMVISNNDFISDIASNIDFSQATREELRRQKELEELKSRIQTEADAMLLELKQRAEQATLDDFAKKLQEAATANSVEVTLGNFENLWQLRRMQTKNGECTRSEVLSVDYSTGKCHCVIMLPAKNIEVRAELQFDLLLALMKRYKVM